MNFSRRQIVAGIVLLVVGLIGGGLVSCAGTGDTDVSADVAKIEAVWDEYAAAVNAGDPERWIILWDENGRQMFPDAPMRIGKDAILTAMEPAFEALDFEAFVINPDAIKILGDEAYSNGTYSYEMTPKAGGDTIEFSGKFSTILAKQDDDSWGLLVDCFNSNGPVGGADAATDEADDVANVEAVWDEYVAAANDEDTERWLALWAVDGLRVPPSEFGPRQFGKDEIRAVMNPAFAAFDNVITIDSEGIEILGEKAYSYGTFELSLTPKEGGDTLTLIGNFLTILGKQEDGSWKILIDTWNN
jgi:uncharacterized protein (TIGR02246 family)